MINTQIILLYSTSHSYLRSKKLLTFIIWEINPSSKWGCKEWTKPYKDLNTKQSKIKKEIIYCKLSSAYSSFNKVLSANINYCASNSLCRVETECVILISFPRIQYSFCVNSPIIYCARHCNIDQLTAINQGKYKLSKTCNFEVFRCRIPMLSG